MPEIPPHAQSLFQLMYQGKDGESMLDAQDIVPHLETLDATTAGHTDTLAAHDTTLGAHDDALAAQSTRIDTLNATLGMQKTSIDALGQRMDESEAAMAEIIKPSDEGVEIHTGAEDGGHVRIFADEIDLNGPVQVLDTDGKLVNINNLPAEVAQLRMEMAEVLEKLNGDLASAVEEIRDLKSRCDFAYEWEVAPYTPTSDRVCRALTEVSKGWARDNVRPAGLFYYQSHPQPAALPASAKGVSTRSGHRAGRATASVAHTGRALRARTRRSTRRKWRWRRLITRQSERFSPDRRSYPLPLSQAVPRPRVQASHRVRGGRV